MVRVDAAGMAAVTTAERAAGSQPLEVFRGDRQALVEQECDVARADTGSWSTKSKRCSTFIRMATPPSLDRSPGRPPRPPKSRRAGP